MRPFYQLFLSIFFTASLLPLQLQAQTGPSTPSSVSSATAKLPSGYQGQRVFAISSAEGDLSRLIDMGSSAANSNTRLNRYTPQVESLHPIKNFKLYKTRHVEFFFSLLATELWYCSRNKIMPSLVRFQDETPTCLDEIAQMVKDPGMHLGVFALTVTSVAVTNGGDKVLVRLANRFLKTSRYGDDIVNITRAILTHVGIGAGMIAQNIVSSVYNTPGLRDCYKALRGGEKFEDSQVCQEAYNAFASGETGTWSEIQISMYSLAISTAISGGVVGGLKTAGALANGALRLLGFATTSTGFIGIATMTSLYMIDFVDRWLEKYIRHMYHDVRSTTQSVRSFRKIYEAHQSYVKHGVLSQVKFTDPVPPQSSGQCKEGLEKVEGPGYVHCVARYEAPKILEALDEYTEAMSYKRRASLNSFTEAHTRWKTKFANVVKGLKSYQDFLDFIKTIREARARGDFNPGGAEDRLSPLYTAFSPHIKTGRSNLFFKLPDYFEEAEMSSGQIELARKLVAVLEKNKEQMGRHLREKVEAFEKALSSKEIAEIRVTLWDLKMSFMDSLPGLSHEDFSYIYQSLSSLSSQDSLLDFFLEKAKNTGLIDAGAPAEQVANQGRKGSSMQQDTDFTQYQPLIYNFAPETTLDEFLMAGACSVKRELIFHFNSGKNSKISLPNILRDPEALDCNQTSVIALSRSSYCDWNYVPDAEPAEQGYPIYQVPCNPVYHGVYDYKGKKYLGLLDLLTAPEVDLIWGEEEEGLKNYWNSTISDKMVAFLKENEADYQNLLHDEFHIFYTGRPIKIRVEDWRLVVENFGHGGFFDSWNTLKTSELYYKPIETQELELRMSKQKYNTGYYKQIHVGESFVEQIRTYLYAVQKFYPEERATLHHLRYLMSKVNATVEALNRKDFDNYIKLFEELKPVVKSKLKIYKEIVEADVKKQDGLEKIAQEEISLKSLKPLVLLRIYESIDKALTNELNGQVYKAYLQGFDITGVENIHEHRIQ